MNPTNLPFDRFRQEVVSEIKKVSILLRVMPDLIRHPDAEQSEKNPGFPLW
jgi:hypothetical protein